jgi:co-chaperonin GroES (HSP10)
MQSLFNFIVEPKNGRYTNTVKIGKKELIINTSIEDHKFVNRIGIVKSIPLVGETNINVNDEVIVHHNVFRRFYDIRGNEKNSTSYFKEDLYFCYPDQIFLYKNKNKWKAPYDFCFVKPLTEKNNLSVNKEQKHIGILKYGNSSLKAAKVSEGDIICFTPNSEYEFIIDNNRLYRMKTRDIAIKYEYKKNEIEYNTSWASGS